MTLYISRYKACWICEEKAEYDLTFAYHGDTLSLCESCKHRYYQGMSKTNTKPSTQELILTHNRVIGEMIRYEDALRMEMDSIA